ncbi:MULTISPECIES: hemin uptake protein HemP [unclassified Serratia (in: enterobacteria)]|uniref:hemin uptake protein HemP n=1 Tax=unclassified Serratia (in: enterobacteria) TaxID=2647522 RepID=UPI002ED61E14|nr:hemin uptake protein HemP [Serratia sp. C2(2)]MEE4446829.1 hemin uptake protein HemP [Serratia sp. C2(1)]
MTMDNHNNSPHAQDISDAERSLVSPPCYDSARLLGADGVAIILHQGQRYQLRQTKAGKLILTK